MQLTEGVRKSKKRAAGVISTSGRKSFHTFDGHSRRSADVVQASASASAVGQTWNTRPMDVHVVHIECRYQLALNMMQQLSAKSRVHLRHLSPQRRRHAAASNGPPCPAPREAWMTPDENGGVDCAISSGPSHPLVQTSHGASGSIGQHLRWSPLAKSKP